jgi:ABC-type transport system substrate-binding protein
MNYAASTSSMLALKIDDPEFNDYLDRGAQETDPEEAQAIYEWVQQWLYDNTWNVPLLDVQWAIVYRDYVDGSNVNNACLTGVDDLRNFDFITE